MSKMTSKSTQYFYKLIKQKKIKAYKTSQGTMLDVVEVLNYLDVDRRKLTLEEGRTRIYKSIIGRHKRNKGIL